MGNSIIDNLRKLYQQEYRVAVFDIKVKEVKKGIELKGRVLTRSQRDDIVGVLRENKKNVIKDDIKILADANERNEIGWAVVKLVSTDLRSRFVSNKIINKKILKRVRCSQALKSEILRVIYKNEDQLLVQQNDLTLGWVNRSEVMIKKKSLYKKWKSGNLALKDKMIKVSKESEGILIVKEAKKYLGAKYLLGGKAKNGIDCSGLAQIAYKNSLNIILPKHSWDQKEVGKKIKLKNVISGDLIFLIKKENGHRHVGIVEICELSQLPSKIVKTRDAKRLHSSVVTIESAVANLIHASLEKKKVVKQRLEKVFENYDFVEARRIVEQKSSTRL